MFGVINIKGEAKKLKDFQVSVENSFKLVKNELDEHLESINHSTNEIQSIYAYLGELDAKLDKMNERIDYLHMIVGPEEEKQNNIVLTNREQEVFLVLYADEKTTTKVMAKKLGFTEEMINKYVYNLISKGVPVLREYDEECVSFSLDLKFKDLQAKKNILSINESISREILSEKTI